jgi:hypothetical protein
MKARYVVAVIAALGLFTVVSPAVGGPSPIGIAKKALKQAKKAKKSAKKANKKANKAQETAENTAKQEGPQGEPGAPGATNVVVRMAQTDVGPTSGGGVIAKCEPGEVATGGGHSRAGNVTNTYIGKSRPALGDAEAPEGATLDGWLVTVTNASVSETVTLQGYAICASP